MPSRQGQSYCRSLCSLVVSSRRRCRGLALAAALLLLGGCAKAYHYGPPSSEVSARYDCYYSGCERDAYQYATVLFSERRDTPEGFKFARLTIIHFDALAPGSAGVFRSVLTFETNDDSIRFDPAAAVVTHHDSHGLPLQPQSASVSTHRVLGRPGIRSTLEMRYEFAVQSHISERIRAHIAVRDSVHLVDMTFPRMMPVRTRPFWQALMGV